MKTKVPFDAVLAVAFGGPEGPGDIRPFLANVLRGRHERFGGVSPLTQLTESARLVAEHAAGMASAVLCPIGFICDHIDVLFDLDVEATETARAIGLPLAHPGT